MQPPEKKRERNTFFCHKFLLFYNKEFTLTGDFLLYLYISFMNLFVAKLSPATTGQDLEELFKEFGEVVSAKVIFDRETGNSKGYGFVEMKNDDEARAAIEALNDSENEGKQMVVKEARPREDQPASRKPFVRRGEAPPHRREGGFGNRRY